MKKLIFLLVFSFSFSFSASWIKEVNEIEKTENEEYILIDGSIPDVVVAENPSTPVVTKGSQCKGGMDLGTMGDEQSFYLASPRDKRWKGGVVNPEAINILFKTSKDAENIEIEIGYFAGIYQTRQLDIILDGERIYSIKTPTGVYGSSENTLKDVKLKVIFQSGIERPSYHILRIYQSDWWGCSIIDAIRIRGKGIKLIDPETKKEISEKEIREKIKARQPHLPDDFILPEGAIGFDFGTKISPCWEEKGFIKITEQDKYDEKKGYGWIDKEGVVKSGDGAAGEDVLRRDYVFGEFKGESPEFKVKLQNGKYRCFFISGGISGAKIFSIDVEDEKLLFRMITTRDMVLNRPAIIHQTIEVNVKDGFLNLKFPDGYFIMNSLIIYPVSKKEIMEKEITKLIESYYLPVCIEVKRKKITEEEMKKLEGKLEATIDIGDEELKEEKFTPSKEDIENGFTLFIPPYTRIIYPYSLPLEDEIKNKISIFATQGEYEPIVFSIKTYKDIKDAEIQLTELKSKKDILAKENFSVYYVEYIKTSVTTRPNGQYKISPKILFPFEKEDLPANFTRTYWITLKVPENTKPGIYEGKITFKGKNINPKEIVLNVEILPFKLKKLENKYIGMYWHPYGWPVSPEKNIEKQLKDMAEHGINATTAYGDGIKVYIEDGELKIDFTKKERIMELKKKYGITGPIPDTIAGSGTITSLGIQYKTEEFEKYYKRFVQLLYEKHKKENWPEIIFYPMDEPNITNMVENGSYLCKLIKSIQGTTTYITNTAENFKVGKEKAKDMDEWLDIYCLSIYSKEDIEEIRKKNKKFFFYSGVYTSPLNVRYLTGYYFYFVGADALYFWVYNWQKGNGYFDLDNDERETGAVICSETGDIISTTWWESLREGVDDLRYLITLEEKLKDCKDELLKKKGEELINEMREICKVGTDRYSETIKFLTKNPDMLDKWRKDIVSILKEIYLKGEK
jgi:hypothetical protein